MTTIEPRGVLAFVGLLFEARIAAGPGVLVFCRHEGCDIRDTLRGAVRDGYRSIISFGVAGGLSPDLRPGDHIVASAVISAQTSYRTDFLLSRKLLELVAGAEYAPIVGVDVPVLDSAHKRVMHETLGAVGVDMESHMVAEFATANGMAFAAMRVVIDPVHRSVPFAAMSGMRPDGGTDASAVLRELVRSPRWVPSIARLAVDALAARNALVRTRRLLGPGLGVLPQPRGENLQ